MIILIALIILTSIGVYLLIKTYDYEILGVLLTMLAGMYLLLHIILWSLASYNYGLFVSKRDAFTETLKEARKNNNAIELAAITKDISEWNQDLAEAKYNLTIFMLKDYTDKRIQYLHPIR